MIEACVLDSSAFAYWVFCWGRLHAKATVHHVLTVMSMVVQDQESKPSKEPETAGKSSRSVAEMSDREIMEKLIVVTPSRKARGSASKFDNHAAKLIDEGLAHLEQEFADVSCRKMNARQYMC